VVQRALERGYRFQSALLNDAALSAVLPWFQDKAPGVPIYRCDAAAFEAITGYNIHRGCLALVHRPPALAWREVVDPTPLVVVLEAVTNADNVGGVFRNAAAFGAGAVLLSPDCCDPLYRKAIRTSMGAVFDVPFARVSPWPEALAGLRDAGFVIAALTPRADRRLSEFAAATADRRVALLVGTEGNGLSDAAIDIADATVAIPMRGPIDSLNLAVATGIALARWREAADAGRQR
jgi:tRNA G18 (ribose-2'-O)-methylase SpoU